MNATPSDVPASDAQTAAEPATVQPVGRTIKRTFSGFNLASVFKFGSAFYLSLAAAWLVGSLLLFSVAKLTGVVANIEGFIQQSGFEEFRMTWLGVFRALFLTGAVTAIALTVLTLLSAYLFNRVADVFGGIETIVVQDDDESRPSQPQSPTV